FAGGSFGNFDTLAIGSQAQAGTLAAGQNDATAVGIIARANGLGASAFGFDARANADQALAVGAGSRANFIGATGIGYAASAGANYSVSIGASQATSDYAVAAGYNAR